MRAGWLLVAILCGAAARAEDRDAGTPPPDAQKTTLTEEDAELVKDLALLERLELLRNLDLFEEDKDARQTKEAQPQPPR